MLEEEKWSQNLDEIDTKDNKLDIINEYEHPKQLKDNHIFNHKESKQLPKTVIEIFEIVLVRKNSEHQSFTNDIKSLVDSNDPNIKRLMKEKLYDQEGFIFDLKFIRKIKTK